MKKSILALSVLSLLILSGCSLFGSQQEVPAAAPVELVPEKKIGLLSTSEKQEITNPLTPFMFILDTTGDRFFVDSLIVNLKKYVNRKIEIVGTFNQDKTIFNIDTVTSLGNETQIKETYQSAELGLKFEYPSIWSLKEKKDAADAISVLITPYEVDDTELPNVDKILIERSENNRKLTPKNWLDLDANYNPKVNTGSIQGSVYQQSMIGGAQMDAVKETVGGGQLVKFYVARDTFMYIFSHMTINDSDKDNYRNAFIDIVQSFEFIPFSNQKPSSTVTPVTPPAAVKPPKETSLSDLAAQKAEEEKAQAEAKNQQQTAVDIRQSVITYIKENIGILAPEAPPEGTWTVSSIQFAFPTDKPDEFNAAYVMYGNGTESRKILLNIPDRTKPSTITLTAYFKPGTDSDWEIATGTDTAKNSDKSVDSTIIKAGMALLDARMFKVKIQYPSKWYWAYWNNAYNFSNKPVNSTNVLVRFEKDTAPLPQMLCVKKTANYCLSGDQDYADTMKQMLETVQE